MKIDATMKAGAATAAPPATAPTRSLRALQAASVVGGLAQALSGAAGALLAREVSGSDAVAGLPQALLTVGSAAAALGLSALTRRVGRRVALSAGLVIALVGSVVVLAGGDAGSLAGVLGGSVLLGAGNTVVMLSRYAAADLVAPEARGRAMGAVLAATTVGAVAGPNLLGPAGGVATALGLVPLTGPFLIAGLGFAAAAATLAFGWRADRPVQTSMSAMVPPGGRTAMAEQWANRDVRGMSGLAVLTIANLVMVGVMTMAPVHLHHAGGGLAAIGLVISLHIAGMFAPSPLSGWLTDRVGAARTAGAAGVVLAVASGTAAVGADHMVALAAALVLLGVGWNLALLSGSALLTAGVPVEERPRREGWGEISMGIAAAGGGVVAGPVMAGAGYPTLAVAGAIVAAVILPIAHGRSLRAGAAGASAPR